MKEGEDNNLWMTERTSLGIIAAATVTLGLLIVAPFIQYVLFGVLFAYILWPLQKGLRRYVSPGKSAVILVALTLFVFIVPSFYITAVVVIQLNRLFRMVQDGTLTTGSVEQGLNAVGYTIDLGDVSSIYGEPISMFLQGGIATVLGVIGGIASVTIGIIIIFFVLFTLLRDGDALKEWLHKLTPIERDTQNKLYDELDKAMYASVIGNTSVAAIQALLLGVGLFIVGIPGVVFLTILTFVLTLLPLVGAFVVWLPLSVYLVLIGEPYLGVFLFIYGSFVSISDLYLRPYIIGMSGAINVAVITLGIFGGVALFGVVGLFIGPVILSTVKITTETYMQERTD